MIYSMVILVCVFFLFEYLLENRFVNSYFNWDEENMHVLLLAIVVLIGGLSISRILGVDIPADKKKILIASELIQNSALIVLLGLFVNVFMYQR